MYWGRTPDTQWSVIFIFIVITSLLIFIVGMHDHTMGFVWRKWRTVLTFNTRYIIQFLHWSGFTTADIKSTSIVPICADLFEELLCPSLFIYWLMMTHVGTFTGTYIDISLKIWHSRHLFVSNVLLILSSITFNSDSIDLLEFTFCLVDSDIATLSSRVNTAPV